jgi:hypothetical protein
MSDDDTQDPNGPSLRHYVETRLTLLSDRLNEKVLAIYDRIGDQEDRRVALEKSIAVQLVHLAEVFKLIQAATDRATDKAEGAQHAVNTAQNEWRGTINDFKRDTVDVKAFDKLSEDFRAYKLEVAKNLSSQSGSREGITDSQAIQRADKAHFQATLAIIVSIGIGLVMIAISLLPHAGK